MERTENLRCKLPSNPFVTYVNSKNVEYVRPNRSETVLVVDEIISGSGFIYSDALITHTRFEFYSVDATSNRSIFRYSYRVEWANKPWLVSDLILHVTQDKIKTFIDMLEDDFLPEQSREYALLHSVKDLSGDQEGSAQS